MKRVEGADVGRFQEVAVGEQSFGSRDPAAGLKVGWAVSRVCVAEPDRQRSRRRLKRGILGHRRTSVSPWREGDQAGNLRIRSGTVTLSAP